MQKRPAGEIVWRIAYLINATGDKAYAEPVVHILADRKGWEYLATQFAQMAKRKITKKIIKSGDSDDHVHINSFHSPVNKKLSHRFEFRLGILSPKTRQQVLRKYNIEQSPAADLHHLFGRLIRDANRSIRSSDRSIRKANDDPKMSVEELYAAFGRKPPQARKSSARRP